MEFSLFDIVLSSLLLLQGEAATKKLIKEANICKRNIPDMTTCFWDNINRILPLLKDGQPEMGIPPVEPIRVDLINIVLPASENINIIARLYDVMVHGISKGRADEFAIYLTENGPQAYIHLFFPEIAFKSNFNASGSLLLLAIDSDGDFTEEFSDLKISFIWNSTKFMKNGREYLKFTMSKMNMEFKTMKMHFNNVFGTNTELNDSINDAINSNIYLIFEEIKPVVIEAVMMVIQKIVNEVCGLFPYDVLFPVD